MNQQDAKPANTAEVPIAAEEFEENSGGDSSSNSKGGGVGFGGDGSRSSSRRAHLKYIAARTAK
jgi:hypothetical protein